MKQYGNESISSLKGADRVRLRPGVIFGSDGLEGCQHSVFEILSNSIDEAREGYGNVIEVVYMNDGSIMISDRGRGTPLDFNNNEQCYNWELIYCELYAGGKYNNSSSEVYEFSLGLNGLGCCATQYSSEYMDVCVYRDGYKYSLHFEKGENIGGLTKEKVKYRHTGTMTKWKPDLEVFTDIKIPLEYFQDVLKKQAVVNAGLRFELKYQTGDGEFEQHSYYYKEGLVDYVREKSGGTEFSSIQSCSTEKRGRDREDKSEYKFKVQTVFCFNNNVNMLEYYHNSSFLEHGGSPDRAAKNALVYEIDKYLKNANKYAKNESKVSFVDIQDSLILVSSSFSTQTSYENQTKKAINNKFIQDTMTAFLKREIEIYFIENKAEADKIVDQILINKRSRESAEKARINIKKKLSGNMDVTSRVQKFVDCRTRDIFLRELYIVEGDSALGSCKMGRDAEFQAIMPVRGKILNCLKSDYDRIFKNDIIVDLLKVLGCGVEIKSKHSSDLHSFELDNLRWNKVIICTDADVDGFQIRTLILAMLYRLTPTLIKAEKVFIAESPLFEITSKGKTYFAYNENEKTRILSKLKDKYTLQRSKGLGENEPEMMWQTTMNPQTRRLIKVVADDIENSDTGQVFDLLLGDNLQGRKEFIAREGYKYINMADVS